jgi:hypothetical protein
MTNIKSKKQLIEKLHEIRLEVEYSPLEDEVIGGMVAYIEEMISLYGNDQILSYQEIGYDFVGMVSAIVEGILEKASPEANVNIKVIYGPNYRESATLIED